jgi:3' exoribonuclease, RNase T-like
MLYNLSDVHASIARLRAVVLMRYSPMRMNREIYISVDVESDGPIPGPNSMLSLGAAAFVPPSVEPIATFSANFERLKGATPDPDTMKWWTEEQPQAWAACRANLEAPEDAMGRFVAWVDGLPGIERNKHGAVSNAVFVGYPAGFDFTYVYWYIRRFGFPSPFSFSALDMKTFAMAVLGKPFRESVKRNMPREWFPESRPHTHIALDDAIEQGIMFTNMLTQAQAQARARRVLATLGEQDGSPLDLGVVAMIADLKQSLWASHGAGRNMRAVVWAMLAALDEMEAARAIRSRVVSE